MDRCAPTNQPASVARADHGASCRVSSSKNPVQHRPGLGNRISRERTADCEYRFNHGKRIPDARAVGHRHSAGGSKGVFDDVFEDDLEVGLLNRGVASARGYAASSHLRSSRVYGTANISR